MALIRGGYIDGQNPLKGRNSCLLVENYLPEREKQGGKLATSKGAELSFELDYTISF